MLFKKKSQTNPENKPKDNQNSKKTMGLLRTQKDLAEYKKEEISFVKLSFPDQNNLQLIHVQISPQQNSIYHQCKVSFSLEFPDTYPMDPPKLKCLNKIYHPNINYAGGVCLPLVREDFSPTVNLMSIVCGLIYLLTYPNAEDALNPEIGDLMAKDYNMFQKIVFHTIEGRSFNNKQYDKISIKKSEGQKLRQAFQKIQNADRIDKFKQMIRNKNKNYHLYKLDQNSHQQDVQDDSFLPTQIPTFKKDILSLTQTIVKQIQEQKE